MSETGSGSTAGPTPRELADRLPHRLRERLRFLSEPGRLPERKGAAGGHVLYWLHHAARGHENPALDTAILAANMLDLPLLVYQGLGGSHPYDNDRHHTFILEGARELAGALADRGVSYAFHLGPGKAGEAGEAGGEAGPSPLVDLARRAALVVSEDFPAPPLPRWTGALAARTSAPVWIVDTACVVPMKLVPADSGGGPHDRAFRFRDAIRPLLDERLERPWPEVAEAPAPFDPAELGFAPTDLREADLPELVARCEIDHTVGPVAHTRGGSAAGYGRWKEFRGGKLAAYAQRRNDPTADGVSRLSPYLHHGHVSPLRIAREAAEAEAGKGGEKYLDELVVWRELAHHLCFHRPAEVESLAVLPGWARRTLAAHADDEREVLTWEELARGGTGDRLWDLCQASLVRHGELHNNVRMTWGKAIPYWSEAPRQALRRMIDLNHRFALDGSDPNSYGGLLWCLGMFDRPFEPKQGEAEPPVLGKVRGRSTGRYARRLDLESYAARVLPPATARPLEVAVVGAGLSGLACARVLHDHGHRVRVFEKSRGVGGRMSTRRRQTSDGRDQRFDHGAQYFTARDPRMRRWLGSWLQRGVVERWAGRIAEIRDGEVRPKEDQPDRFVGVPGMNALCRHLAEDVEVTLRTRVGALEEDGGRWRLRAAGGEPSDGGGKPSAGEYDLGRYDVVVVSAPAPQAAALLEGAAPDLAARTREVETAPCWAAMVTFADRLEPGFDGAFVHGSPLTWVARNASKPGRPEADSWVLHAGEAWSRSHLEEEPEEVAQALLAALAAAVGRDLPEPDHLAAHRWRYARPTEPLPERCLFDPDLGLAACGDWCGGPRVEGAFLSGCAAAGRVLALRPGAAQASLFA